MRIVVTGSNGFVGSWVTREALRRGHRVWATARRSAEAVVPAGAHAASVDTDADLLHVLDEACPHAVVHLAWPVDPETYRHDPANDEGLALARRVFEASARARVPHVVGVGTCLELGATDQVRTEAMRPDPVCRYGTAKNAARDLGTARAAAGWCARRWSRSAPACASRPHRGRRSATGCTSPAPPARS